MKLGQIALIAFIVLAVIIVAFLLLMCCMYCPTLFGGRNQGYENQQNYYPNNIGMETQCTMSGAALEAGPPGP